MDKHLDRLLSISKERWHKPQGLVAALSAILAVSISYFAGIDIRQVDHVEWAVIVLILVVVSTIWYKSKLPRVPKDRVGFGVAIKFDNAEQQKTLHDDFIIPLRQLLTSSSATMSKNISCIEFDQTIAEELANDDEKAKRIAKDCNVGFLLFGRARVRQIGGNPSFVLDLRAGIRHRVLSNEVQQQFLKDFSTALPRRFIFGRDQTIFECELAAKHVDAYIRYIYATAAGFSLEFEFAETLLIEAERRLTLLSKQESGNETATAVLLGCVQKRLADVCEGWLDFLMWQYNQLRDRSVLVMADRLHASLLHYRNDSYLARLTGAFCCFMLRRDVPAARQLIAQCYHVSDAAWMYSSAFLSAYEGDLDSAYRSYMKAFSSPLENARIPLDCVVFIQDILEEEPSKKYLLFCLGLIDLRARKDYVLARERFNMFLDSCDESTFRNQFKAVRKWIAEIESATCHSR